MPRQVVLDAGRTGPKIETCIVFWLFYHTKKGAGRVKVLGMFVPC